MSSITTTHAIPDEVVRYCQSHGLLPYLETALRLVDECFQPIQRLELSVEPDPEVEDEAAVIIDIRVAMTVDEVLKRREMYARRLVDAVPPAVTWEIVLVCNFV